MKIYEMMYRLPCIIFVLFLKMERSIGKDKKIVVFGGGAWGTTIASKIAKSKDVLSGDDYDTEVSLWVFEETVNGRNLTDHINCDNCNIKYLPGFSIPHNVRASSDLDSLSSQADIAIFAVPRKFLPNILQRMKGKIKSSVVALSLIKGLDFHGARPKLVSDMIRTVLSESSVPIAVAVLMGANVATDVMRDEFVESTLAAEAEIGKSLHALLDSETFSVELCSDVGGVELCGALKNVVAMGAGFCDALGNGSSSKAAVMRRGLQEMSSLGVLLVPGFQEQTLLRSCGVADVVASSYGGRNRLCAKEFATRRLQQKQPVNWDDLKRELLDGQELEGLATCQDLHRALAELGVSEKFPLFARIYEIACEGADPHCIFSWK